MQSSVSNGRFDSNLQAMNHNDVICVHLLIAPFLIFTSNFPRAEIQFEDSFVCFQSLLNFPRINTKRKILNDVHDDNKL